MSHQRNITRIKAVSNALVKLENKGNKLADALMQNKVVS
jgi:hypothetical protein